ncbi:prolyl oligopeptidase [Rubrivivax pictus]|uniref:Prolyl oligopeptidase n=2 Tax=Pseudaquabacterium pictum TaxID=2315236 RepID=A0A480ALV0_9BURK|nr:prolyl oligopeptidase [Rubrivivax pictus]
MAGGRMNEAEDPFLWLEEVQGERALAWVHARNAESRAVLQQHPRFGAMRDGFRAILDSADKIPQVSRRGDWFYNLWRDAKHPRGLWRRTTLASFQTATPDWETVLDLDALATAEGENWVWAGATALPPSYRHCLVQLSRGGADATVVREFDLVGKAFVTGGFQLPEAKTDVTWEDADHLLVGTDTGPGSLTDSGYPRTVRRWRRGTPLTEATLVFEGQAQDVSVSAWIDHRPGGRRTIVSRATDFYNSLQFQLLEGDRLQPIAIPSDAHIGFWQDRALLQLRSDWALNGTLWPAGSLLAGDAAAVLAASGDADLPPLQALFTPTASRSLQGWGTTASQVLLQVLDNVAGVLAACQPQAGGWVRRAIAAPHPGSLGLQTLHDDSLGSDEQADPLAEQFLLGYTDFLTPDALLLGHTDGRPLQTLKSRPAFFDAKGLQVQQHWATSKDGTRVPYFLVARQGLVLDGRHPTLLNGYGGFEIAKLPVYSAGWGTAWLAHGGVVAVANIRGGGEFGPAWHQAAIGANKQKSYDDFAAVAEDLIARGVTRPQRLAIQGGSNGGLLVGAVMLQRPELFGAVLCQVPLLDMRRYHRLLAGASWMAEYGNPDVPEEWAWIRAYSPYQNLRPGQVLPQLLFTTSTRDDRVHPGHARKMAARMAALGYQPLYFENTEGGHAGAADNAQKADMLALEFAFLWQALGEADAA